MPRDYGKILLSKYDHEEFYSQTVLQRKIPFVKLMQVNNLDKSIWILFTLKMVQIANTSPDGSIAAVTLCY